MYNSFSDKIEGVKYANFQVLREMQFTSRAMFLELEFLTNWEEAEHSSRKESVAGFALEVFQALLNEIDVED